MTSFPQVDSTNLLAVKFSAKPAKRHEDEDRQGYRQQSLHPRKFTINQNRQYK